MSDIPRNDLDPLNRALEAYTLFLQGVFSSAIIPDKWRWTPDSNTRIYITGEYPYDASKSESRPALVLMPGPTQFLGIGIQDHVDRGGLATLDSAPVETADLTSSSIQVHCLARYPGVAIALGWRVAHSLRQHTRLLARYGRLHTVDGRITMSRPVPAGGFVKGIGVEEPWTRAIVISPFQAGEESQATVDETGAFQVVAESVTMALETRFGAPPAQDGDTVDLLNELRAGNVTSDPLAVRGVPVRVVRPDDRLAAARRTRVLSTIQAPSGEDS